MPEIGSSGLMSGDGKRGVGHRPQATAPILDSTIPEVAVEILADALFAIAVPIVFTPASCRVRNSLRPTNVRIADMFRMTAVWHVSKTSVLESIDSELCSNIWYSLILYPSNLTDLSRVDVRAQRDFSANFGRNHSNSTRLE